jgi:pimeloyl-ACP methyl ester carboxylesterase
MPPIDVLLHPPGVESLARMRREGIDRSDPERFARAYMTDFLLPFQVGDPAAVARIPLDACRFANEFPDHWLRLFVERIAPFLAESDFRPAMKNVTAPVLVVHGEKERAPLEGAREWAAAFPNARLLVVPGAGHAPFSETPDAFFPPVETFLNGAWPDEATRV